MVFKRKENVGLPAESLDGISVQEIMFSLDQRDINREQEICKKKKNKYIYLLRAWDLDTLDSSGKMQSEYLGTTFPSKLCGCMRQLMTTPCGA